jgi:hypothetical protein
MQLVALGALALLILVWLSGGRPIFKHRGWRITSGGFAVAALAAAAYSALREAWVPAIALVILAIWLAISARANGLSPGSATSAPPRKSAGMSVEEARSILGVDAEATPAQIRAAYTRLMRMAHPDKGGTSGLAAQLNAARDKLLNP